MRIKYIGTLLLASFLFTTCSKKENDGDTTTATTLANVGNTWSGSIGGNAMTVTITANDNGVATATINIFQTTYTVRGKATTGEIVDYIYSEGDTECPFTLVKFDAKIGDQYIFNKGPLVVTRTVKQKDVEIYVEALGLYIKCFVVEEIVPEGLLLLGQDVVGSKITYWINHRYGIVYAELLTTWGSTELVLLSSTNVGS